MILPLLILAAQVPNAQANNTPPPGSGLELMAQCIAADGMMLGPASASGETVEKGALCLGYVEGYIDGAKGDVCLPPHSAIAVINSYLMFMKDNPRYLEMPRAAGLKAAIDANYACKK